MTTPLRRVFGGSNRPHHLAMSRFIAGALAGVGLFTPAPVLFPSRSLWVLAAIACYAHEWWATSDRDFTENCKAQGFTYWWWIPYGRAVKHRGLLSHGLVIGTAIRVAYGWWPLLLLLGGLWLTFPVLVAWVAAAMGLGMFVNDLGHLLLDL
jgi:uncharacterized metal-binding protein